MADIRGDGTAPPIPMDEDGSSFPACVLLNNIVVEVLQPSTPVLLADKVVLQSSSGQFYEFDDGVLKNALFGVVKRAFVVNRTTGAPVPFQRGFPATQVAIKCIKKRILAQAIAQNAQRGSPLIEHPLRELALMRHIADPDGDGGVAARANPDRRHVASFIEYCQDEDWYFIIMPFYDMGELFDVISAHRGHLPEDQALRVFKHIARGVRYMHSVGIYHRDLSLENVLVTNVPGSGNDRECVIIDLGSALRLGLDANGAMIPMRFSEVRWAGKTNYMPPELFTQEAILHGEAADIWSLGILLYCVLLSGAPWEVANIIDARFETHTRDATYIPNSLSHIGCSPAATNLVVSMLKVDPAERVSLADIFANPLLTLLP